MIDSCEIMFSVGEWLKTVEMNICQKKNTLTIRTIGGSLSISREMTPNHYENVLISNKRCSWRRPTRAHSLLEVQTMETSIEFFFYLVAMARILVVFLRSHRKSRRKRQTKACDRSGQPVVYRTLAKTSVEWLSRIHFTLLQLDRLQLTAVYCDRRGV